MQFKSLHVKNKSVSLSTLELGTVTGEATGLTVNQLLNSTHVSST